MVIIHDSCELVRGVKSVRHWRYHCKFDASKAAITTPEKVWDLLQKSSRSITHATSNFVNAKLVLAIEKFGDAGCNAEEAHAESGFSYRYDPNGHPFRHVGLFVEPANEAAAKKQQCCMFDGNNLLVGNVSRDHKTKWRLSKVGKEWLEKYVKPNEKYRRVHEVFEFFKHGVERGECPKALAVKYVFNGENTEHVLYTKDTLAALVKSIKTDEVLGPRFNSACNGLNRYLRTVLTQDKDGFFK